MMKGRIQCVGVKTHPLYVVKTRCEKKDSFIDITPPKWVITRSINVVTQTSYHGAPQRET